MSVIATSEIQPRHLPAGFSLRNRIDGTAGPGFIGVTDQVTLIHARSSKVRDLRSHITVHAANAVGLDLTATEKRPGLRVDLNVDDVQAVYHDGWWTPPLPGSSMPQWSTSLVHSLTIHTPTRTYAVRAPREVPFDELVAVARSVIIR
jgi:hypothetical protein